MSNKEGETVEGKTLKKNNIKKVALIFEGGGMRCAFSAGIANTLVENSLFFDYVAGISAGTSTLVNYMTRDIGRTKKSFVDIVDDPNFAGWSYFIKGKGFFNAEYVYEHTAYPDGTMPLNYKDFESNPAFYRIIAYDVESGKAKNFSRDDVSGLADLTKIVRASSSLPVVMPYTKIGGKIYYDGGLTGGIPIDIAIEDGFDKFFIVRTQEKGYRKKTVKHPKMTRRYFRKFPNVASAIINRPQIYNKQCDLVEKLEAEGKAYVVYPDKMSINNRELDRGKLEDTYEMGINMGKRDIDKWKKFLDDYIED